MTAALMLMFAISGAATVLVGLRASRLGVPLWLGRAILAAGALMMLVGLVGVVISIWS